jgi:UDP-N-acetylmuramoyl-tripeptide--D-alanyl-D-alanine ligase
MKQIPVFILNLLARMMIWRYHPQIIGITGSVGKTSTKEAIVCVLKKHFSTRGSLDSYNNEFGLPLAILGAQTPGKNFAKWLAILGQAVISLIYTNYPKILVLEMGADRSGDITKLLKVTGKIRVAVITDIGISHLENYPNEQALVKEKLGLLEGLEDNGMAVLNFDNQVLKNAAQKVAIPKLTYGFQNADIVASDFQLVRQAGIYGINFKVHHKAAVVPFFIPNCLGQPNVYSALAACAVSLNFNLNLVNASEALRSFVPPPGRLRLLEGIKHTWIIDDTYNAAPASMLAGLAVLKEIAAGRKVAVLGDMAELGPQNQAGHIQVASRIQELRIDSVILVGEKARIIYDELRDKKFSGKILWFKNSDKARIPVQDEIVEGDTILVKGSQAVRMEKIVKEIMAEPMDAENLLVRQSATWLAKP